MATKQPAYSRAVHRAILCVDITEFTDPRRITADKVAIRDAMYRGLTNAIARLGIPRDDVTLEDRGNGALVLVPPGVPKHILLAVIPRELAAVLSEHNRKCRPEARIQLRLSFHVGEIQYDDRGVFGTSIIFAFRLLENTSLRRALAASSAELALIVSEWFYREVIKPDAALTPAAYQPVSITVRGGEERAWIRVFPGPHQPSQVTIGHASARTSPLGHEPTGKLGADGFDEFYLANFPFVRNVVNARAQDWTLAEEVTDEAMTIAYRKWDEVVRDHPSQVGYVILTARRILLRTQRQRARKDPPVHPLSLESTPSLELKAAGAGPDDIAVNRTALQQALRDLPPDQRECFVLHEILGHPVRRIAELLNLSEGTVKTRLRAARQTLRDLLSDDIGEEGSK